MTTRTYSAVLAADGRSIQVWIPARSRLHDVLSQISGSYYRPAVLRWYIPMSKAGELFAAIPGLKISDRLWAALPPETRNAVRLQREFV